MTSTDILAGIVDRAKAKVADYLDLSAAELAKQINDEYAVILASERTNYPRALSIGEKLVALRRGAEHGEWQTKLKTHCPKLSYETATKYVRCWKNQKDITQAAAAKGVVTTDLTIELALSLIATPKRDKGNSGQPAEIITGGGKPTPEAMKAREAANAVAEAAALAEKERKRGDLDAVKRCIKEVLAADELIAIAREVRDADYVKEIVTAGLRKLSDDTEWLKEVAAELRKALEPKGTATATTPATPTPAAASAGVSPI